MSAGVPRARIVLNAMTAVLGGGITAARHLSLALAEARPDWDFVVYHAHADVSEADPPSNLEFRHLPFGHSLARRWAWEQYALPRLLSAQPADLLLNVGGYACFATRTRQLSIWQNPNVLSRIPVKRSLRTEAYIRLQRLMQRASMSKSAMNVFQTQDSVEMARDRFDMSGIPHERVHWGFDPPERIDLAQPRDPNLVLAVGHTYYHKNYEALIQGVAAYIARYAEPIRVVVAGGSYDDVHDRSLRGEAKKAGGHVEFLGAVSGEEVRRWYGRASAYVTTSLLETFGLTSLEAMGHGLPVVAARATCHPEVCGEAALYFDPDQPESLAEALHRVLHDEGLAADLQEKGAERSRAFGWHLTGEAFARLIEPLLGAANEPVSRPPAP